MTSITERYLSAAATSSLKVEAEKSTDVDIIIAAGFAVRDNARKALALKLLRARESGRLSEVHTIAGALAAMLYGRGKQGKHHLAARGQQICKDDSKAVAYRVMRWWINPTCRACNGLKHATMVNAPVLDTATVCPACNGSGMAPLENVVPHKHAENARWMVSEIESLIAMTVSSVSRRLHAN